MDNPEETSRQKTRRKAPPSPNQEQTADHIADMAFELREMADEAGLPFLRYLIEMVADEAMRESGKPRRRRTDKQ